MSGTVQGRDIAIRLAFGSYEEAKAWIGRRSAIQFCEDEVNWPQIKYFCSLVRDGNPNYWDEDEARGRYGAIISPPGMLMVWSMPARWRPDGVPEQPLLATQVPLPGDTLINVSTETEFLRPMKVGDRLNVEEEVLDISPEKRTRLGVGHFVVTMGTYRNQRGELIARHRNVLFRFRTVTLAEATA